MNPLWRFWALCFLTATIGCSFLRAQEVRVIKLEWATAAEVDVAEPKITTLVHKPASAALAQVQEIIYVECLPEPLKNSAPGRNGISMRPKAALPKANLLMHDATRLAMTSDVPLITGERAKRVRMYFIYNPGKESDVPARLLELNPPRKPEGTQQRWVWVDVTLDRKGKVVDATAEEGTKPALAELALASVKKWRFCEPWRTDEKGQASLRVPVVFAGGRSSAKDESESAVKPPELISRPEVDSPEEGVGTGLFEVKVDATGKVAAVMLLRSNNPVWAEAMVGQYLASEYKPATKDGQPVEHTLKDGMNFSHTTRTASMMRETTFTPGVVRISPAPGGTGAKAYDSPPEIMNYPAGAYPYALVADKVEDKARFILAIDEKGRVAQPAEIDAAREETKLAVRAIIDAYRFRPARLGGKPVPAAFKSEISFGLRKGDVRLSDSAIDILEVLKDEPAKIIAAEEADQLPQQIVFLKPAMPSTDWCPMASGSVEIEFYIDKKGRAQLPHVISASDPAFGYVAVQAATFWRFIPLKKNGDTVVARARATLYFPTDCAPAPEARESVKQP